MDETEEMEEAMEEPELWREELEQMDEGQLRALLEQLGSLKPWIRDWLTFRRDGKVGRETVDRWSRELEDGIRMASNLYHGDGMADRPARDRAMEVQERLREMVAVLLDLGQNLDVLRITYAAFTQVMSPRWPIHAEAAGRLVETIEQIWRELRFTPEERRALGQWLRQPPRAEDEMERRIRSVLTGLEEEEAE